MDRYYLGLASTYHDPALAIVGPDGEVLFAEATERCLQFKRAFNCPPDHLVEAPKLVRRFIPEGAEVVVAHSWSRRFLGQLRIAAAGLRFPFRPLYRLAERAAADQLLWPVRSFALIHRSALSAMEQAGCNLALYGAVRNALRLGHHFVERRFEHHLSHAALGCYTSPFREAACAVVDGFGEWTTQAFFRYAGGEIRRLRPAPGVPRRGGSLGTFYGMICSLCGFDAVLGEEWKVMGLAAYGKVDPYLQQLLRPLVRIDGLRVVAGCSPPAYRHRLRRLLRLARRPEDPPLWAADLARTGQEVFGEHMRELLANLHAASGSENLVLAGGCALNSSWNGRILAETPFARLHVPSAPADDGNALGAALLAFHRDHPAAGSLPRHLPPYLGSEISPAALARLLAHGGLTRARRLPETLTRCTAEILAAGKVVGWIQGRAEFGPRALGNRSILADPRSTLLRDRINGEVKFREPFRPLAPAVLEEYGDRYFEDYQSSPYMERTLRFRPEARRRVPGVVHVDGTGRLQSVRRDWTPLFHQLISDFHQLTGVPMLLNTSFNVRGRPIVHSLEDAVAVFLTTALDALAIHDCLIEK
jgi:carbamoyltransferase